MAKFKTTLKNLIRAEQDTKRHLPLQVSRYTVKSNKIPKSFHHFRIAFLSDLHGTWHPSLLESLKKENVDLIALGGDYFDGVYPANEALELLDELVHIAPIVGVSGNHEKYRKDWPVLKQMCKDQVLWVDNRSIVLSSDGQKICICGIEDPGNIRADQSVDHFREYKKKADQINPSPLFTIALIHRPILAQKIMREDFDLILSGHTHGGQWRFFGIGLAGPGLEEHIDLFPEYDGGRYQLGKSEMIVSRGISDQMWIPRLFNNPDLVVIQLESDI
ncbi:metallophosphoesterase [Ileibacterium valens]|uniref:metallophosphoesterase n=2 Tax=Ileibacterium valens TaxID=1862668 RepID=UPI0024BAAC67|nr:metallophosphoesterase [Ileibacterium valens]